MKKSKDFIAYIALGSNQQEPVSQIQQALKALQESDHIQLIKHSLLYVTKPLGPPQEDFINAVAEIHTTFSPLELLHACQTIENNQGRIREERWGPRTLDLDILLYDEEILHSKELTIPHYAMKERSFVIIPLYEIAPLLVLPTGETVKELYEKVRTTP